MHVKSCPKLLRSELRLDLGHHQGVLLRRGQNQRAPLAALSSNTPRCGPAGGALVGGVARAKENAVFTDDEVLDVWSVIKPGHVREKIALFAHNTDRNVKGSWDVTVKRRRRTSQIQPVQALQLPESEVTLSLQPAIMMPPEDPPMAAFVDPRVSLKNPPAAPPVEALDDDAKLSVVEMVAFLEQHVITRPPHAKLRSSASIMLSRAPPPLATADSQPAPSTADWPITALQREEPPVSVSDMVAKLESQCLRRRTQTERRTVGRVLLAKQNSPFTNTQPISSSRLLRATPTPSSATKTRKTSVSLCKSDVNVKVSPCFSTDSKAIIKTPIKSMSTLSERSNAIGRGKIEASPFCLSKLTQLCKSEKYSQAKLNRMKKINFTETQESDDISIRKQNVKAEMETSRTPEIAAKNFKTEDSLCDKDVTNTSDDASKTVCASLVKVKNMPQSVFKVKQSSEALTDEEPVPGLLFLTPPSKPCIQSEQRKPFSPASLFPNANTDLLVALSPDITAQLQMNSDQSVKKKLPFSQSPTSDSSSISSSGDFANQLEKRKAKSDSNLLRSSLDLVIQSETSKPNIFQSVRSCLTNANTFPNQPGQSQNGSTSFSQSEKRMSYPVTASELSIQSEARIELFPLESQSQRRRLSRLAQSEKRKSCPVMVSDWLSSQNSVGLQSQKHMPDFTFDTIQSEQRKCFKVPPSSQSEARPCGSVLLRSSSEAVVLRSSSEITLLHSSSDITELHGFKAATSDTLLHSPSDALLRSSSDTSLRSSSDTSLRSSSDTSLRSSSDTSLRLSSDTSLRSSSDTSLRSSSDTSLRSSDTSLRSSDDFPLSSSDVTVLNSSSDTLQCSSTDSLPRSSSDVVLRSSADALLCSSSDVVPRSSSDAFLRSSSNVVLLRSCSDVGSERRRRRKAARAFSLFSVDGAGRYGRASEDFLLMRRRVQSLLEPRSNLSYLSLLPHHLLLQILLLLPTRTLAALKCTCHYLRLVIDTYDPRPLDALWVCDPRYRDDPCKQCKRGHQRGDVSLCRWHHKPFCQAMPYGPGYWMCCHGDRRDAPGCNVGLHDNRWVPAFHSINSPIYRQRLRAEHDQT